MPPVESFWCERCKDFFPESLYSKHQEAHTITDDARQVDALTPTFTFNDYLFWVVCVCIGVIIAFSVNSLL